MSKKLSEMTLEELWELFPIVLSEHDPEWKNQYDEEAAILKKLLPSDTEYHHVGSTAIKGIMAKPIVDILILAKDEQTEEKIANILSGHGYIIMAHGNKRISLNKGYTEKGFAEKVFHLHVRLFGDADEIYFRDYLNAHPDIAKEYESLKLDLLKKYEHDRDAYTAAKTDFVTEYTRLAKLEAGAL